MGFPLQFKGIDSQDKLTALKNYLDKHEDSWGNIDPANYWQGRTLFEHDITDPYIQSIMKDTIRQGISLIKQEVSNGKSIYCEHLSMARWPVGYELRPHADAENPVGQKKHEFSWRDFACITFLNDDFEGGNLYFPELDIEIIPEPGNSICFPGTLNYLHGVKKIISGVRYTIASFLTYDVSQAHINI
jgi:prolyl 4-hydroxylase